MGDEEGGEENETEGVSVPVRLTVRQMNWHRSAFIPDLP